MGKGSDFQDAGLWPLMDFLAAHNAVSLPDGVEACTIPYAEADRLEQACQPPK